MTRHIVLVGVVLGSVVACHEPPAPATAGSIDLESASRYFSEFDELCREDDGSLWGASLCGPILIVDPSTRMAVANQADEGGVLKPTLGIFTGELPPEVPIANTAVEWAGTRWTMLMVWSLSQDRTRRLSLMAHEAFHRVQPQLDLAPFGEICAHLDTADGRFWLQMEWNALQEALSAEGQERLDAAVDALAFRAARWAHFPNAAAREVPLEIFEGLAEYTGMRLAGFSVVEVIETVAAKREQETGLVRSFAYVSGPLYGFLLDGAGIPWRDRVRPETDLGVLLAGALDLAAVSGEDALERAEAYGGPALLAAEQERARARQEQLDVWRASLIEGPVLIVDLTVVGSGSFDPGRVFPFDETSTVYTTRELIADWGVLTVTDGAILEDAVEGRGRLSLTGAGPDALAGDGWTLELEDGWEIVEAERPGDRIVRSK
jgi:hypothetical protein